MRTFVAFLCAPLRRGRCRVLGAPIGVGLAIAGCLGVLLALASCAPTEGTSTEFEKDPTTNGDFTILTVGLGDKPIAVDVADYNGDDLPDVAVANYIDGTITVLTNAGGGSFVSRTFGVGGRPTILRFANLDDPGGTPSATNGLDLVVLVDYNARHSIVTLRNSGTSFSVSQSVEFNTVASQIEVLCVAETPCSAGTVQDIAIMLPVPQILAVLVNDGSGTLVQVSSAIGKVPSRFVVGDINGDANPDIAVIAPSNDNFLTLLGAEDGSFTISNLYGVADVPSGIASGGFGGAGGLDLAITTQTKDAVQVFLNDGAGGYQLLATIKPGENPITPFVAKFDGTNDDLVFGNAGEEKIFFLKGNGAGGFGGTEFAVTENPFAFAAGDYSGDGALDLVTVESTFRVLSVFRGNGAGAFTRTQIGFDSLVTHPLTMPASPTNLCGGAADDLLLLQPNLDRLLILCSIQ